LSRIYRLFRHGKKEKIESSKTGRGDQTTDRVINLKSRKKGGGLRGFSKKE